MARWKRSGRATDEDHLVHCADFMRFYLVKACDPVEAIQHYSHRVRGRGSKKEELKHVPENIVEILISELPPRWTLLGPIQMAAEELMDNPTKSFLKLGSNNEERKKALEYRKDCRRDWTPNCSVAINRAL
ncbi:hypothetical protein ANCCAN_08622 [Ancylostoma caninum]|uniref:Uncharacterized protein n=1 Tax=Ancylostoma caninum TaxID=29170 RepID=A0A368GM00_ANCCA|nr:hypothetical protein ANCCAN_08622 [Ancylostoma caninum]